MTNEWDPSGGYVSPAVSHRSSPHSRRVHRLVDYSFRGDIRPKPRCQNGGDGFPWSNAAAYEAHCNWATGSTNGRLPQETFFQMVRPRFGAPLTSWSYSTPKCMRTASKRMLRLWLGGRLS